MSPSDDIEKKKEFFMKLNEICEIGTMIAINLGDNNIDDIVGSSSTAKNVFGTSTYLATCMNNCLFICVSV